MIRGALLALLLAAPAAAETVDGSRFVYIDGDTVRINGETIRIENIDTGETRASRCPAELVKGLRAKERLASLLRGGLVSIDRSGEDRYGRTLARLSVGGRDVGEVLIAEGLAIAWENAGSRENRARHWCGASKRWK